MPTVEIVPFVPIRVWFDAATSGDVIVPVVVTHWNTGGFLLVPMN